MHWYDGTIAEAVTLSKQRNAIFVVFVEGDNDISAQMLTILDHADILKRLSDQQNFLAIKLTSGSVDYTHFAQIYQFVPVPSLFFIGRNGTPLEVVCPGIEPAGLATRIDRILQEHNKEDSSIRPSTSNQNVKDQTQDLLQSEAAASKVHDDVQTPPPDPRKDEQQPTDTPTSKKTKISDDGPESSAAPAAKVPRTEYHEVTSSGQEYDVVCDDDVCTRVPKARPDDPGPSKASDTAADESTEAPRSEFSEIPVEAKVDKAKELIEARRREKMEKEKEEERQKEIERRAQGQGVGGLRRWQADQEMKQLQEERKREKQADNMARQRILEQIAQDRAERRAREAAANPALAPAATPAPAPQTTSGDTSTNARIQFKMPDGASRNAQFSAEETLAGVRRYVADNLLTSPTPFTLWTAFPRRELTEDSATLRRLELAPSAALLVLERHAPRAVAAAETGGLVALLTHIFTRFLLEPTEHFWNWMRFRLFGGGTGGDADQPPRAEHPEPTAAAAPAAPGLRHRPRTNIHRMTGDRPGEDDNNTWNGNSTQQM